MNNEDRMVALESKLTSQEDLLDELNQTVYRQQKKIDQLEELCIALAKRISNVQSQDAGDMLANERPPHY
jgi:SlyX protein